MYTLEVDGFHLREGLRWFEKIRKVRKTDRALFSFDTSFLLVEAFDRSFIARAEGEWPGVAATSATLVQALAAAPPAGDDVCLTCDEGGKLRIGSLSVPASWTPSSTSLVVTAAVPDWIADLMLKYRLPRARVVQEGLAPRITAAERELDRLVRACARKLAPLHVTDADLHALVERRLGERDQHPRDNEGGK